MKSINVKRVAAVVAGAAMIGSVMASGLAAVTQQGDVPALVDSIKDHLGTTKVVLGSAADISDGIQAAKLAAVLASLNYQSAGTVSGDGTVTVESTSAGVGITASQYDVEYTGSATTASNYDADALSAPGKTITATTLSNILSDRDIVVTYSSASETYPYREEVLIGRGGTTDVKYSESSSTVTPGYGLYWNADSTTGEILYRLNFVASGNGLPCNKTNYGDVPTIKMLGTDYSIDLTDLNNHLFSLYSGEQLSMSIADTYDVTGTDGVTYTVTLSSVDPVTTTTGTKYKAMFKVTDGTTTQSYALEEQVGYEFFSSTGKVTVYPTTILGGTTGGAIVRVGTGKQRFNIGTAFPLDSQWTVYDIDYSSTATAGAGFLQNVTVRYGNPSAGTDTTRLGAFTGNYLTGLKEGIVIHGPKNLDGVALFDMQLIGFGSTSPVQTTPVTVTAAGGTTNTTDILQVKWYSQDGVLQDFAPVQDGYANWSYFAGLGADDVDPWLTVGTVPWTVINDKVVQFLRLDATGASTPAYYAVFSINGQEVKTTQTTTTSAANVTLSYTTPNNPITCTVGLDQANKPSQVKLFYAATVCDTDPGVVYFGDVTQIDQSTKPSMNLTKISGGSLNTTGGTVMRMPMIKFDEPVTGADDFTVVYDSAASLSYTGAADTTLGIIVFNTTVMSLGGVSDLFVGPGDVRMVDGSQTSTSLTDATLHHVTAIGTVLDGTAATGSGAILGITMPEKTQNAIVRVAASQAASNASSGAVQSTLSAGQSVGGVKIISISTGLGAGDYYTTRSSVASPENLVVLDSAAPAGGYRVVVGGPWVNTIAAGISDSSLVTEVGAQYLIASDNDLLAAGYSATDTTAAVTELIDLLTA